MKPQRASNALWRAVFALPLLVIFALLPAASALAQTDDGYRLRAGDRIAISVLEDPAMNQTSLIRPDGRISLALVGSLVAAGRTAEELQAAIGKKLRQSFVATPSVTVSLIETEEDDPPAVFVLGQVNQPGRVEMDKPLTLLQALAVAGGPAAFAATKRIVLRRDVDGAEQVFTFDYEAIEQGEGADIRLEEGDVIVVPERRLFD